MRILLSFWLQLVRETKLHQRNALFRGSEMNWDQNLRNNICVPKIQNISLMQLKADEAGDKWCGYQKQRIQERCPANKSKNQFKFHVFLVAALFFGSVADDSSWIFRILVPYRLILMIYNSYGSLTHSYSF